MELPFWSREILTNLSDCFSETEHAVSLMRKAVANIWIRNPAFPFFTDIPNQLVSVYWYPLRTQASQAQRELNVVRFSILSKKVQP